MARLAAEVDWFILAVPTGVFEGRLILNGVTLIDQTTTQPGNPKGAPLITSGSRSVVDGHDASIDEAPLPDGELFTDEHLDDTCAKLAGRATRHRPAGKEQQIRDRIRKLDQELNSYRTIVRTEPEAASAVGKWIAETNQERHRLEALLGRTPTTRLTAEDIKALVASLQDISATLAAADPADKAKIYAEMGIDITNTKTDASWRPAAHEFRRSRNSKGPAAGGTRCRREDSNLHEHKAH